MKTLKIIHKIMFAIMLLLGLVSYCLIAQKNKLPLPSDETKHILKIYNAGLIIKNIVLILVGAWIILSVILITAKKTIPKRSWHDKKIVKACPGKNCCEKLRELEFYNIPKNK